MVLYRLDVIHMVIKSRCSVLKRLFFQSSNFPWCVWFVFRQQVRSSKAKQSLRSWTILPFPIFGVSNILFLTWRCRILDVSGSHLSNCIEQFKQYPDSKTATYHSMLRPRETWHLPSSIRPTSIIEHIWWERTRKREKCLNREHYWYMLQCTYQIPYLNKVHWRPPTLLKATSSSIQEISISDFWAQTMSAILIFESLHKVLIIILINFTLNTRAVLWDQKIRFCYHETSS